MRRRIIGVVAAGLLVVSGALAQVTTGTISGSVTDTTGAVLPGARIIIQNEDTGVSRTVQSDARGHYSAPSLSLGRYRVTLSLEGFQTQVRSGIVLTVGREAVVDLQLSVGAVSQTVEVSGEAPLVQTTESTVSYLTNNTTISEIPLNGRDLSQLILLNPGVSESQNGVTNKGYTGYGKRISISGMTGESNAYLLDGSYINDFARRTPAGPSGAVMGVETVREFQVLTSSYGAQYGRVLGGVFNAVTKSGTNEWHGDIFEFLRNSSLDARNFFDRRKNPSDPRLPPFRRNQFGATLGGPIQRDKTFFFAAYEGRRESLTTTAIATVPNADARLGILPTGRIAVSSKVAPFLPLYPLPTPGGRDFGDGSAQFIYPANQPTTEDFGQFRVDRQFSDKDSAFARFTGSNSTLTQALNYPIFTANRFLSTRLLTLSETHVFSPRMLNTARFSFNRVNPTDTGTYPAASPNMLPAPGQTAPPAIIISSGITNLEGAPKPLDYFISNRFTVQDDVNYTLGKHSLQFGGSLERLQFNKCEPDRPFGEWSFSSLATFLQGVPNTFRGAPPALFNCIRGMRQDFFALYLQDDWRVTPRLTINLGLRWEPYTVPTEVNGLIGNIRHIGDSQPTVGGPLWLNHSWNNIGPRVGFAWSPFQDGKTSIRGGFALLYVPVDPAGYFVQITRIPPFSPDWAIPDTGHFPDAMAEISAVTGFGSAYGIPYDNHRSSHALQYNFGVQRQIGANNVLTVGFAGSRGMDLLTFGNYNMPPAFFDGVSLAYAAGAKALNPNFSEIDYFANNANSWYNGLMVGFQRKFSSGFQAQISYTYSKALSENDSTDSANEPQSGGSGFLKYPLHPAAMKGLSSFDFRQQLSANYVYAIPLGRGLKGIEGRLLSGWQLSGILTVQSGQPFWLTAASSTAMTPIIGTSTRSPNSVPGFTYNQIVKGGTIQYFNPKAYSAPGPLEFGNVGRNTLVGPGLGTLDLGLEKNTNVTERLHLSFRAELFNLLNHANLASPASSVFSGTGAPVGNAGVITATSTTARQVQFGLKLVF